jgi:PAS domain S-box-containing protein
MIKFIKSTLKNPNLLLFFAIVSSAIMLIIAGAHPYNVIGGVLENSRHSQKIRGSIENIRFIDEVLTSSTLLAVSTGDAQWEKRYHLFELKLDSAINELFQMTELHSDSMTLSIINSANVKLVAMEHRVFELIHLEKRKEAYEIITSTEYARQKVIYSEGIYGFIKLHDLETARQQTQLQSEAIQSKWVLGLVILLLIILWLPIANFIRRSRAQILKQNQTLELEIQKSRKSEEKTNMLAHAIKISADCIAITDKDYIIIFVNESFNKVYGFKEDEIIGQPISLIQSVNNIPDLGNELFSSIVKKKNWTGEVLNKRKDGSEFPVQLSLAPLLNDEDELIAVVGVLRDITRHKAEEEALRASQDLIEGIINAIPVRIFWKDRNSVYLGCNSIFARDAGFSDQKDIIGKDDFQMGWRDQAELYRKGDRQVIESGIPILLNEEPQTTPEGNTIILLTNKILLKNSMGEIYGILGTSMNVTERIAAVQEIKLKNEQLQKLNAEKDKFYSIIAHDLRSPFNGFLGFTQVMAEELPNLTMAEVQEIAVSMRKSATNLYSLLNNLLEWSQIQQGAIPFNPKIIQFGLVVGESIDMIRETARSKEIEIETDIDSGLEVFADQNMLQTVIRNLISNAVKFTYKGGRVILSAKADTNNSIVVSIRDTGIGMSQTIIENLFRIDVQTNRNGTEGEPSTGLGLLLCKEFIEKHGGKIWVESEVGEGSTFSFSIPLVSLS